MRRRRTSTGQTSGIFNYQGLSLAELGRVKEAASLLEKALQIDPHNADVHAELGHLFLKLEFHLRAQKCFEKAVSIDPSHKRAAEGLGNLKFAARVRPPSASR